MYVHQNPTEIPIFCTYIGGSAFHWLKVRMYVHRNRAEMLFFCTYIGRSAFHWLKVRMYVHRNRAEMLFFVRTSAGELRKCTLAPRWRRFRVRRRKFSRKWRRFHFRAGTCTTRATLKADSRRRFRPAPDFGTCTAYPWNLRRLPMNVDLLIKIIPSQPPKTEKGR